MNGVLSNRNQIKALLVGIVEVFVLASCAFLITLICSFAFLHNQSVTGFSKDQVDFDFRRLLIYLINPLIQHLHFQFLSLSHNAQYHFKVVKGIIGMIELTFVGGLIWQAHLLAQLKKDYQYALNILVILKMIIGWIIICGMLIWINFTSAFITIHRWLFTDLTWIFNPRTDPIVWAMPITFFSHLFLMWLCTTVVMIIALILYLLSLIKFRFDKADYGRNQSYDDNRNDN